LVLIALARRAPFTTAFAFVALAVAAFSAWLFATRFAWFTVFARLTAFAVALATEAIAPSATAAELAFAAAIKLLLLLALRKIAFRLIAAFAEGLALFAGLAFRGLRPVFVAFYLVVAIGLLLWRRLRRLHGAH
jgi:hypothetical protein